MSNTRRLASHWMVYDPDLDRCLCISDPSLCISDPKDWDFDKILWEKGPSTQYIILSLEKIEYLEKKACNLVTTEIDASFNDKITGLVINFLTKKRMWMRVIFVPIVGNQYIGHHKCTKLPPLDFVNGFRI